VLVFGNDNDSLQWIIRAFYESTPDDSDAEIDDEMPSTAMWTAFNAEINAWLMATHEEHPISLFIKPIDEEYGTETNEWHDWSCERIPELALPIVQALGKKLEPVARYLEELYDVWLGHKDGPQEVRMPTLDEAPACAGSARTRTDVNCTDGRVAAPSR
jgi:hypothetical protein